ncbi:MAG: FAD-dependent oxidoreductase [archaeon]
MHDIIIIGAGFAGYTAAIYAARYNMKPLVIASELGGLIVESSKVCNYPGFKEVSGLDLMTKFMEQAKGLGAEISNDEVLKISKSGNVFLVETRRNKKYETKTLVLALGTKRRKLNVPGAAEFEGKGIHYCATCDAAFYRNKAVAVIGGSNSAAHAAMLLSNFAKQVYLIYRGADLRCEPTMKESLIDKGNVKIIYNTNLTNISGSKFVEKMTLDHPFDGSDELKVDGIFIEIGGVPGSAITKEIGVALTESGEIIVNQRSETNVPGVFAAGDVTNTVLRQGIVAAAQGAIAGTSAYQFITGKKSSVSW